MNDGFIYNYDNPHSNQPNLLKEYPIHGSSFETTLCDLMTVNKARNLFKIIDPLTFVLVSFFRMVHGLNRNIISPYFPYGIYGMCCACTNYVCTRRIEEKIRYCYNFELWNTAV